MAARPAVGSEELSSNIWNYFEICANDESNVKCKKCKPVKSISRGNKDKRSSWGHKGMIKHLKAYHSKDFEEYMKTKGEKAAEVQRKKEEKKAPTILRDPQPTIDGVFQQTQPWPLDSPKSKSLVRSLVDFICADQQPLSVVEDEGFLRLMKKAEPRFKVPSRFYMADKVGATYDAAREQIYAIIGKEDWLAVTSDIWSSRSNDAYISLVGHYVNAEFERKEAVLACSHFAGGHGGQEIAVKMKQLLAECGLSSKLHIIMRDSGSNMVKGFRDANLPSAPCLAHIINNVVNDGLKKGDFPVPRLISCAKKIVQHFKHSPKATAKLRELQANLLPPEQRHELVQSCVTRWNSDFEMLKIILEQKLPIITALAAEENTVLPLKDHQWELLPHVLTMLEPFLTVTERLSRADASISQLIPFEKTMKNKLAAWISEDEYLISCKEKMLTGLAKRCENVENDALCYIATALDPRYKLNVFDKEMRLTIRQELERMVMGLMDAAAATRDEQPSTSAGPSAPKRKKASNDDAFDEMLAEAVYQVDSDRDSESEEIATADKEVKEYLSQSANLKIDPLKYWKEAAGRFPHLAVLARRYLGPPPTSVSSERLFSTSGGICADKRARLTPERLEQLVFLNKNIPALQYQY